MIESLVGRLAGLFEKEFLFASFLPCLIFVISVLITLAGIIGFDAIWLWISAWMIAEKAVIATLVMFGIISFSYILSSLRTFFLLFWSGMIDIFLLRMFLELGKEFHLYKYHKIRQRAFPTLEIPKEDWKKVFDWLYKEIDNPLTPNKPNISPQELQRVLYRVESIHERMSIEEICEILDDVIDVYSKYAEHSLSDISEALRTKEKAYLDLYQKVLMEAATAQSLLDQKFGTEYSIRATALGNVVEAYSVYPYKRYGMEQAEIFWPRLQYVIKPELQIKLQESRILLDFYLLKSDG